MMLGLNRGIDAGGDDMRDVLEAQLADAKAIFDKTVGAHITDVSAIIGVQNAQGALADYMRGRKVTPPAADQIRFPESRQPNSDKGGGPCITINQYFGDNADRRMVRDGARDGTMEAFRLAGMTPRPA